MRAWALFGLLLAVVCAGAMADMTVLPTVGNTGIAGTAPRKIGDAYPHVVFAMIDSVSTVADQYDGDTPRDAAYIDTIGVARDWNGDGVVDSIGVGGEWTPVRITSVEYCGLGPDTLWLRGLSEAGTVMWERRFIPPTNLTRQCWSFDPILAFATRLVAFAGRANRPSLDDWTITAYCARN